MNVRRAGPPNTRRSLGAREIAGISPFFIVSHVPSSLSFYRDQLGFQITRGLLRTTSSSASFAGVVRRSCSKTLAWLQCRTTSEHQAYTLRLGAAPDFGGSMCLA